MQKTQTFRYKRVLLTIAPWLHRCNGVSYGLPRMAQALSSGAFAFTQMVRSRCCTGAIVGSERSHLSTSGEVQDELDAASINTTNSTVKVDDYFC